MSNTQKSNKRKADEMEDEGASSQLPEFIVDNLDNIIGEIKVRASSQGDVSETSAAKVADILVWDFEKWKIWYYGELDKKAKESDSAAGESAAGDKKPDYHGQTILDFYRGKETMHLLLPEFHIPVVSPDALKPDDNFIFVLQIIQEVAEKIVGRSVALIAPDTLVAPRLYVMLRLFWEIHGSPTGTDLLHFLNTDSIRDKTFLHNVATKPFNQTLVATLKSFFDVDLKPGVDMKTPAVRSTSRTRKRRKISPQRKEMMEEKVLRTPPKKAKKEEVPPEGNTFKEYYDACAKAGQKWAMSDSEGNPYYEMRSFWDIFRSRRASWYREHIGKVPIFKKDTFDEIEVGLTPEEKEKKWREKKEKKRKRREKDKQEQ